MKRSIITGLWAVGMLCMSVSSCREIEDDYHHYYLHLNNSSEQEICAYSFHACPSWNSDLGREVKYDDCSVLHAGQSIQAGYYWLLNNHDFVCGFDWGEPCILENAMRTDPIYLCFFDAVLLRNHLPNSLLAIYRLNRLDLKKLDWHVSYPPTSDMTDSTIVKLITHP